MPVYTALYGFNLPPAAMVRFIYKYGMNCTLLQVKTVRIIREKKRALAALNLFR